MSVLKVPLCRIQTWSKAKFFLHPCLLLCTFFLCLPLSPKSGGPRSMTGILPILAGAFRHSSIRRTPAQRVCQQLSRGGNLPFLYELLVLPWWWWCGVFLQSGSCWQLQSLRSVRLHTPIQSYRENSCSPSAHFDSFCPNQNKSFHLWLYNQICSRSKRNYSNAPHRVVLDRIFCSLPLHFSFLNGSANTRL